MSPKIFVLRAYWTETHDDSDEGQIDVCNTYDDVSFSGSAAQLQILADNLEKGYSTNKNGYWTHDRSIELRSIWPKFDDVQYSCTFKVEDISELWLV